jgi:hypothetical protein
MRRPGRTARDAICLTVGGVNRRNSAASSTERIASLPSDRAFTSLLQARLIVPILSVHEIFLHLALDPTNGSQAKLDSTRKVPLSLQLIDHGSVQFSHFADLRQTKYLERFV